MIRKMLSLALALFLALLLCSMPVAAQLPVMPHSFWGTVTIDGSPAPDGTVVSAHIGGLSWPTTTSGGQYGYSPTFMIPADDPATTEKDGGLNGDEIVFKVNGIVAATDPPGPIEFENGGVGIGVEGNPVNLSVTTTGVTYYTLTVNVSPSGSGTVALSLEDQDPTTSGNQYESGTTVTVTANPASGYVFDHWSGDLSGSTNPTSITMDGDKSVTAHFRQIAPGQYSLIISSTEGGSVTTPGEGTFAYDAGEVVELVASPDDGYQFDEWTGDVSTVADANDAATTITMDADKSITAGFTAVTPGISPASFSASSLLISPQQVQPDQPVEISIDIANNGGTTGSRTVLLYINGKLEDSYTASSIAPGSLENVVFTVSRSTPGTYEVSLEGLQGQFTVAAPSGTSSPGGLGTGTLIVIVAIIVALIAAIVLVFSRIRRG